MAEYILGTEINEFVTNRQNTKIQFFQKQNELLHDDIKDLQNLLRVNKDALKCVYAQSGQAGDNTPQNLEEEKNDTKQALEKFIQETNFLYDILQRVLNQRNEVLTKLLIQEQISEETQNFHQEIVVELQEKIQELRRIIHDQQFAIQQLQKCREIPEQGSSNVISKIKEITNPNDQSIRLHEQIEEMKIVFNQFSEENSNLNSKNEFYREMIHTLQREIIQMRIVIMNPMNKTRAKGLFNQIFFFLFSSTVFIHRTYLDFLFENFIDINDEDSQLVSEFYDMFYMENVTRERMNNTVSRNLPGFARNEERKTDQDSSRHTNISSTGSINNDKRTSKSTTNSILTPRSTQNPLQTPRSRLQASRESLLEQITFLEQNLKRVTILFQRETINNNLLVKELEEMKMFAERACETNEILAKANLINNNEINKLKLELKFYKNNNFKYTHNNMMKRARSNSSYENQYNDFQKSQQFYQIQLEELKKSNFPQQFKFSDQQQQEKQNSEPDINKRQSPSNTNSINARKQSSVEYSPTIKALNNNTFVEMNNLNDGNEFFEDLSLQDCKNYIIFMYQDLLNQNQNLTTSKAAIQILNSQSSEIRQFNRVQFCQIKRSMSDPIDYIYSDLELRKKAYQVKKIEFVPNFNDDTIFSLYPHLKADQNDLSLINQTLVQKNDPFNLDMSVITKNNVSQNTKKTGEKSSIKKGGQGGQQKSTKPQVEEQILEFE